MTNSNLPASERIDSAENTKVFFENYGIRPLEFSAAEVDAAIGFFSARGFDDDAAEITAAVLLNQAKIEGLPVFQILDSMKSLTDIEVSGIVAEILNNNRPVTSALGYKVVDPQVSVKARNILG